MNQFTNIPKFTIRHLGLDPDTELELFKYIQENKTSNSIRSDSDVLTHHPRSRATDSVLVSVEEDTDLSTTDPVLETEETETTETCIRISSHF